MTSIKKVCLQVAVAGVVAGGGSAVATAVAHAETPAPDTAASAGASAGQSDRTTGTPNRSRGRVAKPAAAAAASSESAAETPRSGERPRAVLRSRPARGIAVSPSVTPPRPRAGTAPTESIPTAAIAGAQIASPITAPDRAGETAATAPAVSAAVAAPAALQPVVAVPAPAAPAPTPVPVLPLLPALPVAPASAVTVTTSAATTRRTVQAAATVQLVDTPTHVLLIGTDGTNLSKILEYTYDQPNSGFRAVMDNGITGATSLVGHTTISGPSWSTILTGAWDNKTGVINNLFNPAPYDAWPTVFNLIEYNKPSVNTAVVANWRYINDIADAGGYPADVNTYIPYDAEDGWEAADDAVADATIALINDTGGDESTFIFSYQVGVDEEGHLHGGDSPQYRDAVINTSENIKAILNAVADWELANPGEQWTVIVTTDHGHQQSVGLGHGFQSPNETSSFVMFDIEGDDTDDGKQNLAYTTADITPTIVDLFGIAQRTDFDGVPLQDKATSIVDPGTNLKQALNDAIAMYGYPNIGTDIALGVRTVFASIPYFIDGFVTDISDQLQSIVDQDIFLISALAGLAELAVDFTGGLLVGLTQAIARVVATLTGSGVIAPNDPPLPAPPAAVLLDTAVLA